MGRFRTARDAVLKWVTGLLLSDTPVITAAGRPGVPYMTKNGGTPSGAAAHKRAARKRRNIRKNKRGAR